MQENTDEIFKTFHLRNLITFWAAKNTDEFLVHIEERAKVEVEGAFFRLCHRLLYSASTHTESIFLNEK